MRDQWGTIDLWIYGNLWRLETLSKSLNWVCHSVELTLTHLRRESDLQQRNVEVNRIWMGIKLLWKHCDRYLHRLLGENYKWMTPKLLEFSHLLSFGIEIKIISVPTHYSYLQFWTAKAVPISNPRSSMEYCKKVVPWNSLPSARLTEISINQSQN